MQKSNKLLYAQSSDIKARTFAEYRKDMKKKAIFELEIIDWLNEKIKTDSIILSEVRSRLNVHHLDPQKLSVRKSGGDRFLWFTRNGKDITREPDYEILYKGKPINFFIELQYAENRNLQYFDFKLSKVSKKIRGKDQRLPHNDRLFLYIIKNSSEYTFITPMWIINNGNIGTVPAWGSRPAYRVPKQRMEQILKTDISLRQFLEIIDKKTQLLNFQHQLIEHWQLNLKADLEKVVDENIEFKIIPNTLNGFFKTCFILQHIQKIPENVHMWLSYILDYTNTTLTLKDIAFTAFSIDFLYYSIFPEGSESLVLHEIKELEIKLPQLEKQILSYLDKDKGIFVSDTNESLLKETQRALFAINILEDIKQDAVFYYGANFKPIQKIYETLPQESIFSISRVIENSQVKKQRGEA